MTLTEWRKAKNLTMTGAADVLGISQSSISRAEAGKQWPDKETLELIFQRTGGAVTPNDFFMIGQSASGEAA